MRTLLIVGVLLASLALAACQKAPQPPSPTPTAQVTVAPDAAAAVLQQLVVPKLDLSAALAAVVEELTDLDSLLTDLEGLERLALQEDMPKVPEF